MNIFISHSWKNKTAAQLIAESIGNGADIWLDIRQLKPGDRIQPVIDEALAKMDVVLLLWSKEAVLSHGVDEEIQTAFRLNKKILPVLLDATSLDAHPLLKGVYGINFDLQNSKPGLFRIMAAIVRLMMESYDIESASVLNDITESEGFTAYIEDYRNRQEIGGDDSILWALRSMEQCNKTFQSVSDLRDQVGDLLQYIQNIFARVQASGDDATLIQSILDEVIRHPKSGTKEFKVLITFIEGKLSSLTIAANPKVELREDAAAVAEEFAQRVGQQQPSLSPSEAVGEDDPALMMIQEYIRSAPESLQQFTRLTAWHPSVSLKQVANELHAYLSNPQDLIPDDQNGLLGFIDDAWLIHNTIYRCIEAGFFRPDALAIAWDRVVQADRLVVQLLPLQVRTMLEQLLMQYLRVISQELAPYQPQFMAVPPYNSYGAFMDNGSAVGGTSYGGTGNIDDVIYQIGDKMVYYGGS